MKKIIFALLLLVSSVFADVEYVDIFDVYDKAADEHKVVMVMLSKEGCPGCQYMENVVFNDKKIAKILKDKFVVAHVDIDKDGIPDGMDYFATPTFYFLDADENILKKLTGGENAKDFASTLQKVKAKK